MDREHDTQRLDSLIRQSVVFDGLGGDVGAPNLAQHKAGLTAANITVASPHADFAATVDGIYNHLTLIDGYPEALAHVETLGDIASAKATGRFGIMFGLQDASALGTNLRLLTILHKMGVRIMSLTYNERNALGDGCLESTDQGLTHFGKQVVRDMGRLRMVLDLSHVGSKTSFEAMRLATRPPVFSHSNPAALTPSPRNISDDQIRAIGDVDGLVGICTFSPVVYSTMGVRPTVDDYLDRIEYVANLIGIDRVGIGSDIYIGQPDVFWRASTKRRYPELVGTFDRHNIRAEGYNSHAELKNVAHGLKARGYSDDDILKVLGGNWMRVLAANFDSD